MCDFKVKDKDDLIDKLCHVIVESGIVFDDDWLCRCDACRDIARRMDEAGYIEQSIERWWEPGKKIDPEAE